MNNIFNINEKINTLYNCINEMGGIIDLPWCDELLYPYYNHFDDSKDKYKVGSLVAFWGLLEEWNDGSGFPFYTGKEKYECHNFEKYMEAFMNYSLNIKSCYPNIYRVIVRLLMNLDKYENFEDTFTNIDVKFITKIRDVLLNDEILFTRELYKNAYSEAGL
ncbi:hypothetical protein FDB54_10420 [Clostridium botulinum]|nr:hypothetical protein [Clostridium botulinum]